MNLTLPKPDAPFKHRLVAAGVVACLMPVLWPVLVAILFVAWLIIGIAIGIIMLVCLALPGMVLFGVEEKTTQKFEVEVDNDKVLEFKQAAASTGARVEEK